MFDDYLEVKVEENLKDAGCDNKTIDAILKDLKCGDKKDAFKMLEKHRSELLNELHKKQKEIDCLDYLVFQMEKEK